MDKGVFAGAVDKAKAHLASLFQANAAGIVNGPVDAFDQHHRFFVKGLPGTGNGNPA